MKAKFFILMFAATMLAELCGQAPTVQEKAIEPPRSVWKRFVQAALAGDAEAAASFTTGDLRSRILRGSKEEREKFLEKEFGSYEGNPGKVNEIIGQSLNNLEATVIFKPDNGDGETEIIFKFSKAEARWFIVSCGKIPGTDKTAASGNIKKLKQIALACWFHSSKNNDKYPDSLSILKGNGVEMDEDILLWTNPRTKKEKPFISCPGLGPGSPRGTILVASPEPVNGRRDVLLCDGTIGEMSENEFREQAGKQKWELPAPEKSQE